MIFPLDPTPAIIDPSWVAKPSNFTPAQLDGIVFHAETLKQVNGMVGGPLEMSSVNPELRQSQLGWLYLSDRTRWMYTGLGAEIQEANALHWNADITGFHDALQYTTYTLDGHYSWHQDKYAGNRPQRKLAASLLLSDPSEYDGGDLEINDAGVVITIPHKDRGTVIVFPSYVLHRVTPVTRGTRKSLVGWVSGPRWR